MKKLLFILCVFLFTQCEKLVMDREYSLTLKNNSDFSIIYFTGVNINPLPAVYPDTTLYVDSFSMEPTIIVSPGEIKYLIRSGVHLSNTIKELPADTLSIYLFHIDTLKNNTWSDVRDGYKILKRYDLSLEDLEYLDYKLSYPPDAKMSGVKMYPPYP